MCYQPLAILTPSVASKCRASLFAGGRAPSAPMTDHTTMTTAQIMIIPIGEVYLAPMHCASCRELGYMTQLGEEVERKNLSIKPITHLFAADTIFIRLSLCRTPLTSLSAAPKDQHRNLPTKIPSPAKEPITPFESTKALPWMVPEGFLRSPSRTCDPALPASHGCVPESPKMRRNPTHQTSPQLSPWSKIRCK